MCRENSRIREIEEQLESLKHEQEEIRRELGLNSQGEDDFDARHADEGSAPIRGPKKKE